MTNQEIVVKTHVPLYCHCTAIVLPLRILHVPLYGWQSVDLDVVALRVIDGLGPFLHTRDRLLDHLTWNAQGDPRLVLPFLADTKAFLDMICRATGLLARAAPFNVDGLLLERSTGRAAAYPRNTRNSNDVIPMDLVLAFGLLRRSLSRSVQGQYGYSSKKRPRQKWLSFPMQRLKYDGRRLPRYRVTKKKRLIRL